MRKIEDKITRAFFNFDEVKLSKRDRVYTADKGKFVYYALWGHRIAKIASGRLYLRDAGYQTTTTKSRLNAILLASPYPFSIFQKDFAWYIHDRSKNRTANWIDGEWNDISALANE